MVADGYRLIQLLTSELAALLTEVDVDPGGRSPAPNRAVLQSLRLIEFTRSGRRIVTAPPGVGLLRTDDALKNAHKTLLDQWQDVIATLTDVAPRFQIEPGEVPCLENYRSLHGRDGFDGERRVYGLRIESTDAM